MKILHTADWHLGRSLHGADLTPAFEQFTSWIVDLVNTERIDAVLIAGDIFDRGIAPVEMVTLLSQTLNQLSELTQVVLIPGNHDSAKRLGFGSELMRKEVQIRINTQQCGVPVPIFNKAGKIGALVYPIPYLDPTIEREKLSVSSQQNVLSQQTNEKLNTASKETILEEMADKASPALLPRTHQAVLSAAMEQIKNTITSGEFAEFTGPQIVMAHAFISGSEPSSSETNLEAGGVDAAATNTFEIAPNINYVALGHIHRPQTMHSPSGIPIRYSGSPIAFSFSEAGQEKSVTILEFSELSNTPEITKIPVPSWREISTIEGTFAEIIGPNFTQYRDDFVRIYLRDELRPDNAVARLRQIFPNLLQVQHQPELATLQSQENVTEKQNSSPLELITKFFTETGNRELSETESVLISEIWTELNKSNPEEK
ncbi:MAG: exonuclease SbcCD subunit D [Arcanobacterium sp.]|nr:exonuclease SbcCD subunit D [Arcanobacterium sp.]